MRPNLTNPALPAQVVVWPLLRQCGREATIPLFHQSRCRWSSSSTQPGRNNREGTARLGVDAASPQTYAAGALLANHARLTEIYGHYVVIEREGKTARLYVLGEAQPQRQAIADLLTVGGKPPPEPKNVMSRETLTDYIRPTPVYHDDRVNGFALFPGRQLGVFAQLGLESGDVLTEINGQAVTDPNEALTTLHSLIEGSALQVVIERQGMRLPLSLDGSILLKAVAKQQKATEATDHTSKS